MRTFQYFSEKKANRAIVTRNNTINRNYNNYKDVLEWYLYSNNDNFFILPTFGQVLCKCRGTSRAWWYQSFTKRLNCCNCMAYWKRGVCDFDNGNSYIRNSYVTGLLCYELVIVSKDTIVFCDSRNSNLSEPIVCHYQRCLHTRP